MSALRGLIEGRLRDLTPIRQGHLARALAALNGDGEETRLVGGAVRDLALGGTAQDFDLATTASPAEVIRRGESAGFKVVPTGIEHGTVTLVVEGRPIETTTLREDVETDGRRAKVAFGRDFAADARRRDFTMNALSLDASGVVHDPLGGLQDLAAGRVRFIGDADQRIREDYLRILRFFRFSARFGAGAVDPEGLSAAIRLRDGLQLLSRERVRGELLKLVAAPYAVTVVVTMADAGFLELVFGGVGYPTRFQRLTAILSGRDGSDDAILRLAGLAVVVVEDADRLRERLRLTNSEHRRIASAASALEKLHGLETAPSETALRELLFRGGKTASRDALALAQAESRAEPSDPAFAEADLFLKQTPEPKLPIRGADIEALGVEPGPRVGAVLRAFTDRWVEAGFPEERSAVERLLITAAEDPMFSRNRSGNI